MSEFDWNERETTSRDELDARSLPRLEDLRTVDGGYDRRSVEEAFDAFHRHAAQLDATLRVLESVTVFRREAEALRDDLRALRSASWGPVPAARQPWGSPAGGWRSERRATPDALPRIAVEAAFIVAVALAAGLSGLAVGWVVAIVLASWVVVGVAEIALAAARPRAVAPAVLPPSRPAEPAPVPAALADVQAPPAATVGEDTQAAGLAAVAPQSRAEEAEALEALEELEELEEAPSEEPAAPEPEPAAAGEPPAPEDTPPAEEPRAAGEPAAPEEPPAPDEASEAVAAAAEAAPVAAPPVDEGRGSEPQAPPEGFEPDTGAGIELGERELVAPGDSADAPSGSEPRALDEPGMPREPEAAQQEAAERGPAEEADVEPGAAEQEATEQEATEPTSRDEEPILVAGGDGWPEAPRDEQEEPVPDRSEHAEVPAEEQPRAEEPPGEEQPGADEQRPEEPAPAEAQAPEPAPVVESWAAAQPQRRRRLWGRRRAEPPPEPSPEPPRHVRVVGATRPAEQDPWEEAPAVPPAPRGHVEAVELPPAVPPREVSIPWEADDRPAEPEAAPEAEAEPESEPEADADAEGAVEKPTAEPPHAPADELPAGRSAPRLRRGRR